MRKKLQKIGLLIGMMFVSAVGCADVFSAGSTYQVCFTPGGNCAQLIIDAIDKSQEEVLVQAYSFTAKPIIQALLNAHQRGVKVAIILDKSVVANENNAAELLGSQGIPIWIDEKPGIAHNKVMIIDREKVITGSYNFTRAAQRRNAENLLIIGDVHLANDYLRNWQSRESVSRMYQIPIHEKIHFSSAKKSPSDAEIWIKHFYQTLWNTTQDLVRQCNR